MKAFKTVQWQDFSSLYILLAKKTFFMKNNNIFRLKISSRYLYRYLKICIDIAPTTREDDIPVKDIV